MHELSKNQRRLFSLLSVESMQIAAPLTVSYREEVGDSAIWSTAVGFIHMLDVEEPTVQNRVFVSADNNVTLMAIALPWNEIRAAKVSLPTIEGDCLVQKLSLFRCRDYLSDRDLFTREPRYWFEEALPVLEITIGGFFSEKLRDFVAKFPDEANVPLGDLAAS